MDQQPLKKSDSDMLDAAVEKANKDEILSNLGRWKDQLNLLLEAGFSERHAIMIISNLMMGYL
jgi:hypothetical protein